MTHDADSLKDPTHAVLDHAVRSASVTRAVAVERGAIAQLPHLVATAHALRACLIVADPATLQAAGHAAIAALRNAGIAVAAPIVLDLALFSDFAHRAGMKGIQEWLSFYYKSPMAAPGLQPEHDLFIQQTKLKNTLRHLMGEDQITHLGLEYYA